LGQAYPLQSNDGSSGQAYMSSACFDHAARASEASGPYGSTCHANFRGL